MSSDVGGDFGSGFTAADGACAEKCVCTALDSGLSAIVEALTAIDNTLGDKLSQGCDVVGECQSEIQQLIDDSLTGPTAALEALTSEISFITSQLVETQMGLMDLATLLNEENFGVGPIFPPPPPPPPIKTYYGWCDFSGGEVLVTDSQVPPGSTFKQVSYGDNEQVVYDEALNTCKTYENVQLEGEEPDTFKGLSGLNNPCDITAYKSFDGIAAIIGQGTSVFDSAGLAVGWKAIADLGIEGVNLGSIGAIIAAEAQARLRMPPLAAHEFLPKVAGALGNANPEWAAGLEVLAAIGQIERFVGMDLKEFKQPITYALNVAAPRRFAEPKEALDVYLANGMTIETLTTHYAIAGYCPTVVKEAIIAEKSNREIQQLVALRRREIIDGEEYAEASRHLGYIDASWAEQIFELSEHLPDIATAARIVQSGATDEQQAERIGLDTDFDQFIDGKPAEWLKGNGITDETAELFWRSHWQTPGVSTLLEFWHRLRDDDTYNANGELEQDIRTGLTSLAIPPFWADRIMAVALSPLLKRDIHGAYTSGALSDDDLPAALKLTGHSDDAVDVIVKELLPMRRHAILNHVAIRNWTVQQIDGNQCRADLSRDGFTDETITQAMQDSEHALAASSWSEAFARGAISRADLTLQLTTHGVTGEGASRICDKLAYRIIDHQAIRDYTAGTLSRASASDQMSQLGMTSTTVNQLLGNADSVITNSLAALCERGVRSQYVTGGLERDEAIQMLQGFGLESARVVQLVDSYDCQRKADGKEVGVEKLCGWLYNGIIDQEDFYSRLLRLGYSEDNARLLVIDCVNSNTLKAIKEQKRLIAEQQRDADKAKRDIERSAAAAERRAKQLAKMRSDAARLRGNRQKQYVSAAEKVYKATSTDLQTALLTVRQAMDRVKTDFALNEDEALKIAIVASESMKGQDVAAYLPLLEQLAAAAASGEPTPSLADIGEPDSTNGFTQPS